MPHATPPPGPPSPPRGVPRWLWPPPGATLTSYLVREHAQADGGRTYELVADEPLDDQHLRALRWLLDEYDHAALPPGCPFEGEVRVIVARTGMPGGRVGHAYALDDGPLGAPAADQARGVVWRFLHHQLGLTD